MASRRSSTSRIALGAFAATAAGRRARSAPPTSAPPSASARSPSCSRPRSWSCSATEPALGAEQRRAPPRQVGRRRHLEVRPSQPARAGRVPPARSISHASSVAPVELAGVAARPLGRRAAPRPGTPAGSAPPRAARGRRSSATGAGSSPPPAAAARLTVSVIGAAAIAASASGSAAEPRDDAVERAPAVDQRPRRVVDDDEIASRPCAIASRDRLRPRRPAGDDDRGLRAGEASEQLGLALAARPGRRSTIAPIVSRRGERRAATTRSAAARRARRRPSGRRLRASARSRRPR